MRYLIRLIVLLLCGCNQPKPVQTYKLGAGDPLGKAIFDRYVESKSHPE